MALGTATNNGERMKSHSHALDAVDLSFLGDSTYPAGGTPGFQAYVRAVLKRDVTILGILEQGLNGGHTLIYDPANDKLIAEVKATGVEAAPGDLSGITFRVVVLCY